MNTDELKELVHTKFRKSVRHYVIDKWIEHNHVDKELVLKFLDDVELRVHKTIWNPYDLTDEGESLEEQRQINISKCKKEYKDVIDKCPIEVLCYIGVANIDELFNKTIFDTIQDPYDARFTPEYERILINSFDMIKLFNVL